MSERVGEGGREGEREGGKKRRRKNVPIYMYMYIEGSHMHVCYIQIKGHHSRL